MHMDMAYPVITNDPFGLCCYIYMYMFDIIYGRGNTKLTSLRSATGIAY